MCRGVGHAAGALASQGLPPWKKTGSLHQQPATANRSSGGCERLRAPPHAWWGCGWLGQLWVFYMESQSLCVFMCAMVPSCPANMFHSFCFKNCLFRHNLVLLGACILISCRSGAGELLYLPFPALGEFQTGAKVSPSCKWGVEKWPEPHPTPSLDL